jgi:predicted NUDIX family NTP pyrophosphohydrolase
MIHWEYPLSIPLRDPCKQAASGFLKGVLQDLRWARMAQHESAGCLVYRIVDGAVQFLLVHPSGASFRKRLFGIPKGLLDEGENAQEAALRETQEETSLRVRIVADLGTSRYPSGKEIHAFLAEVISGEVDEKGNTSHDWEVDVSKFYPLLTCRKIIHPDQEVFLDRALEFLG